MAKQLTIGVIGGGAAGLMAAHFAVQGGADVTLLEGNEKLGKKIYITGKGRCNLTNAATGQEFFEGIPKNPRFFQSAFSHFSNEDMMAFMQANGVPVTVERGGRVFPSSNKASDVTRVFERLLGQGRARLLLGHRVRTLARTDEGFLVKTANGQRFLFDRVILAGGGVSYPSTGSDGSLFSLVKELGHDVTPLLPSLIPMVTNESWAKDLMGLSLKNVRLKVKKKGKLVYDELGEMLFTHFGISGPLVLSASAYIAADDLRQIEVLIDMKPGLDHEQLTRRLRRDLEENPKKQMGSLMPGLVPRAMGPVILKMCGIDEGLVTSQLPKQARDALVQTLKGLPLTVSGFRPIEEAIVTRGGVSVKQINPKTMESKLVPGMYMAGEMLDIDGFTGGYNLQIAWSTGALAGASAANNLSEVN